MRENIWYNALMIEIDELHIEKNYRFNLNSYIIVGRYLSRNENLLMLENAFVYLGGDKNRFIFEESLTIDATKLKNITIDERDSDENNSDYYSSYDYKTH